MAWNIESKGVGGLLRYRIWSTIVDEYIVEKWMTREEIVAFLFWHRFRTFIESFTKDAMTFPNQWSNKDGKMFCNAQLMAEYYKFMDNVKDDDLVDKFSEEVSKLGISLSVSDGNVGFKVGKKKSK